MEAAGSHLILPSQPQMLQCVYSFLELEGGGPKTNRSTKNNNKETVGRTVGRDKVGGEDGLH